MIWKNPSILVFLLTTAILFFRLPDRFTDGFLWAEDVNTFMSSAYQYGIKSLFMQYAGYLHLVPRSVAYAQTFFGSPESAPFIYSYFCVGACALGSVYVFDVALKITKSNFVSIIFSLSPYVIVQSAEVLLNITNIQWILALTTFMLIWDVFCFHDKSDSKTIIKSVFLLVFGLTGPFLIIFAPFALYVFYLVRGKSNFSVVFPAVCIIISIVIQSMVLIFASDHSADGVNIPSAQQFFSDFMVQGFFSSKNLLLDEKIYAGIIFFSLTVLVFYSMRKNIMLPVIFFTTAVLLWVLATIRIENPDILTSPIKAGARYYFVPYSFMFWSFLLCFREAAGTWKLVPTFLSVLMLSAGLATFSLKAEPKWEMSQSGPDTWEVTAPPGWRATIHVRN